MKEYAGTILAEKEIDANAIPNCCFSVDWYTNDHMCCAFK